MHGTFPPSEPSGAVRPSNGWTPKEHEVVITHWPDIATIRRHLPHRTVIAIRGFGRKCNLPTGRKFWTAAADSKLRKMVADGQTRARIAEELDCSVKRVETRMSNIGITLPRRPPKPNCNPLVTAVRQRAFERNLTLTDLDLSLGNRQIFKQASGRQNVKLEYIDRAVKALGGKLVVEWEEE